MKRWFVGLLAIFALATAQAQTVYGGGSLALLTDGRYSSPLVGVQVGADIVENLELRATFETQIYASSRGVDLLYRASLGDGLDAYGGAGPEILFSPLAQPTLALAQVTPLGSPNYALHGTLGLEYRTGQVGFFGEAQPLFRLVDFRAGSVKFRTGVNYFF